MNWNMRGNVAVVLSIFALLVGCSGSGVPKNVPDGDLKYTEEEYLIGVGDGLSVKVWRNPELSVAVQVRPDGKISVPLANDVYAAGLTAEQLAESITAGLQEFIRSPQVTVIVTNPSSKDYLQRVRVIGAVNNPKSIQFRKGMTVVDLVLGAGGVNDFASGNKAKLYRQTPDGVKVYDVYLDDILKKGRMATNYSLVPSDTITVPERIF